MDTTVGAGKTATASIAKTLQVREGLPFPRGAHWDGKGVNFALFSEHATRVEVCLFDEAGKRELHRIDLPEFTDEIWHGYIPDLQPGTVYGYRVHGPYEPEHGHRFNANKLLLDPYARAHVGPFDGTMRVSVTKSAIQMAISLLMSGTARPTYRNV